MKIIIGTLAYRRAWILPKWFESIENQNWDLRDLGFAFLLGPDDAETHNVLFEWQARHPEVFCFNVEVDGQEQHDTHPENRRIWSWDKYKKMARLRNRLLDTITCISPDRYFSLDSDILLENPDTISSLAELTENHDAVSTLAYMTPKDTRFPSVMSWVDEVGGNAIRNAERYKIGELFQSDIIMASKMMSKPVFENVRYKFHNKGEDLGWSCEMERLGFSMYCASYIYTPHIMHRWMLEEYNLKGHDPRYDSISKTDINCV